MGVILTKARLEELGRALHGDGWEARLAERLKVSRRTIMRWKVGECGMPAGLLTVLLALVEQQIAQLGRAHRAHSDEEQRGRLERLFTELANIGIAKSR